MSKPVEGQIHWRGDEPYEKARRAAVWHAGTPNRFPAVIVQARTVNDVIAAVQLARDKGMKMTVRSGGHSWAGSHLRDGIVLLDVSQLRDCSINREAMTATAQPGLKGSELNKLLMAQDLVFPTGHCTGVCIGGYLLQGGFGWNGRKYGPACMSVTGIDVVTADGKLYLRRRDAKRRSLLGGTGSRARLLRRRDPVPYQALPPQPRDDEQHLPLSNRCVRGRLPLGA